MNKTKAIQNGQKEKETVKIPTKLAAEIEAHYQKMVAIIRDAEAEYRQSASLLIFGYAASLDTNKTYVLSDDRKHLIEQ